MNITRIRADLVAAIGGLVVDVDGVGPVTVTAYADVPSAPELPCVYPGVPERMYDFSYGGSCVIDIAFTLAVSRADETGAQAVLGALVTEILTLGLPASTAFSDVALTSIDNFRAATFGNANVLAADFNLSIRTT